MAKQNQDVVQEEATSSLQDFNWDETETFFGIKPEDSEVAQVIKAIKGDDDPEDNPTVDEDKVEQKEKVNPNSEEEDDFFPEQPKTKSEDTEKEDEVKDKEDSETEEDDAKFYTTLAKELKEKGTLSIDLPEDEEIDEQRFFELQEAEIEARVSDSIEAFGEDLDEDGKAFLKFKKQGGNTQDFLATYQDLYSVEGLDLEEEKNQNMVISLYLKSVDGMDEDEITDRLEWLKDNGKKKNFADKYSAKLKEIDDANKAELLEKQNQAIEARKQSVQKFNNSLQETLNKIEKVKDFSFSKVNKKELMEFITKPTVKSGKNRFITPMQDALGKVFRGENNTEKEKFLLLAKLLKSDFDVKDLLEAAKTETLKKAKSKLQEAKAGVKPSTSGSFAKKSIADLF